MEWVFAFFTEYAVELGSGAAVLTIVEVTFAPFRAFSRRWRKPEQVTLTNPEALAALLPAAPPTGTMHMDLATFEAMQERALAIAKKQLAAAHGEERQRLEETIEGLNARLRDPEEALAQQQAIINGLEEQLSRRGNEIGGDDLAAAKTALEAGDFTKARALFETLSARTAPEVAANADAEFALGQIAEAEIRWPDAARHYATAARLNPVFRTLYKARQSAWRAGEYPAAFRFGEDLLDAARATGSQEQLAIAGNEHAITLQALGRHPEAEGLYRQALDIDRATIGEGHPAHAIHLNNLAAVIESQGRYPEAEGLFRQALEISRVTIGEGHPGYATHLNNLAAVVESQGRYPEAEGLYRQALGIDRATIGEGHPGYATHLNNLASVVEAQGRYPEAEGLYRQALDIDCATIGEAHPDYAIRLNNLAQVVRAQGRYPEAEGLFRQALEIGRATIGEGHPGYATHLNNFAGVVEAQGRYPEAERFYAGAMAILRQTLGDGHPNTRTVAANFLDLITSHLPASLHRAEIEALLAGSGDASPDA